MTGMGMAGVDPPQAAPSEDEGTLRLEEWSYEDLTQYFKELFAIGDENGEGVLQPKEVHTLCAMSGFNLTTEILDTAIEEADTNKDGVIDYFEFVPMLLSLLRNGQNVVKLSPELRDASAESLSSYFMCVFAIADVNQDGVLSKPEVKSVLTACGYELDEAHVSRLVEEADMNGDGLLQYDEFVPMILKMLGKDDPLATPPQR